MKINYLKSFIFLVIVVLVCMTISFSKEAELQKPCCDILEVLEKIPSTEGTVYWQDIEKLAHVKKQNSKFARVKITYDKSLLNEKEKKVLLHLVEAAKCMNEIYLMQSYSKNLEIQKQLSNSKNPLDKVYLSYFDICFGPFDCLDENKNYIDSALFPETANFYPEDMTKEEFNNWIKDHPKDKENFNSWYTVIRRYGNVLKAIPYSQEYKTQLEKSAMHLKEAAKLSDNESLKKFLNMRADSFLSNEYYNSELAWMDVKDSKFEVVIGPYEVYTDRLFNNKTAFEAFICLNDPEEEKKLEMYANHLRLMEENLPLANEDKNFARSFNSPIRVVQEVYVAGDARAGIQTSAFNLPNDEKVRETKGCKKVMLKNVMEAKFNKSLIPIAKRVIEPTQLKYVTFLGYFNHVLLHELSHGLGPGIIKKDGKKEDTKVFLEETYSIIEEAKADTLGIYNQLFLIDKGKIPEKERRSIYVSFLAGIFRSVRFGVKEAHGQANIIQFNWMIKNNGIKYDKKTCFYSVDFERFEPALKSLVKELLEIEAKGDKKSAEKLIEEYGSMPEYLSATLNKLTDIPVDIEPVFEAEKK